MLLTPKADTVNTLPIQKVLKRMYLAKKENNLCIGARIILNTDVPIPANGVDKSATVAVIELMWCYFRVEDLINENIRYIEIINLNVP